jgi:hypothetical protein
MRPNMVKLHDGTEVSSWSREWMLECEARHLLGMPLGKRREALEAREKQRGVKAVDALKKVMSGLHAARKGVA